jgi:hypothetical protein
MNILPKSLTIAGFQHTQIMRDENYAVYRQSQELQMDTFEVIRIQKHKAGVIPNGDGTFREVEEGETYPKANRWGIDGWTFREERDAMEKFWELKKAQDAQIQETPQP